MVEFRLEDDQKQIQDMMRKFAQEELRKKSRDCDDKGQFEESLLDKIWELGVVANAVPECYGGYELGRSAVTGAIMVEELAWGDVSLAMAALSPMLLMIPVLEFGSEEQKKQFLPKLCGEKFYPATAALMEPRVRFDPTDLQTTVELAGDKLVLNGTKCMVPLADRAEQILVYAAGARGAGPASVEAIIVDKGTQGMTIGPREKNMGLRSLPLFNVTFKDCEVSKNRKVGEGKGLNYMRLLNISRAALGAMAVGISRASLEYAINYAKERYAFGEPIGSRQAIAFMLAESAMEVDAMRLLAWRTAWRLDRNEDATRDATLTKMYCAEQAMKICDYGVQILGGHGYIREHPVEMWFRNGRAFACAEGLAIV